jgi:surface carbohydrate biosynthesis protein (TIGR04326 family)
LFDPAGGLGMSGIYTSQYWTRLPAALVNGGYKIQWLHYFHSHDRMTTVAAARARVRQLNSASTDDAHALVEDSATAGALLRVSLWWVRICIESYLYGWGVRRKLNYLTGMNCWSLIRDDWAKAFRGYACVQSLFFIACFDRALRSPSHYQDGLYLMENQGWERALAQAWRKYGHGRLTGAAHSTVRFWDLRYHCDPRRYTYAARFSIPGPDVVALNGPTAYRQYLSTCAAREEILKCEALRYLHLRLPAMPGVCRQSRGVTVTLLILGDYSMDQSIRLLRLVEEARQRVHVVLKIRVKSHPTCPIDVSQYPGMEFLSTDRPVTELVRSADWVLASNSTSAVLDAYLRGARLLIHNDGRGVNLSPLRGVSGVGFVGDATDLTEALENPLEEFGRAMADGASEFFYIEENLPAWSGFFGISVLAPGGKTLCEAG